MAPALNMTPALKKLQLNIPNLNMRRTRLFRSRTAPSKSKDAGMPSIMSMVPAMSMMASGVVPTIVEQDAIKMGTCVFQKYRTHGNDYLLIDNMTGQFDCAMKDVRLKNMLCNRVFGLGAIGLCEIRHHATRKFEMVYHLAIGIKGRACGTGTRCAIAYAQDAGIVNKSGEPFDYQTFDGGMTARIEGSLIEQTMSNNCRLITVYDDMTYFVDVAWWVHVRFVNDGIMNHDIVAEGMAETDTEKYSTIDAPTYILAEIIKPKVVKLRSFDRTAKDYEEMYACGTGGIAMSISYLKKHDLYGTHELTLIWQFGVTKATITRDGENHFTDIKLTGHARRVYTTTVDLDTFKRDFLFFEKDNPQIRMKWRDAAKKLNVGVLTFKNLKALSARNEQMTKMQM